MPSVEADLRPAAPAKLPSNFAGHRVIGIVGARLCLRRAEIAIPAPQHKEPKKRELRPRAEEPIASVGERASLLIFPFTHRCRGAASYSEIDRTEVHP